jgi:hydroxypyruvate isomerase
LNCKFLISQTGNERTGIPREVQAQSLVDELKAAVPYLEKAGIILVVEPLNTLVNHKGYYLKTSKEAFHIINQVNSKFVKVLFDVYHQQVTDVKILL